MKTKSFLMTGVLCMAMIGCFDISGGLRDPALGIGAAEAKDYYTRKKIDGRWVTGVFPKKGTKLEAEFEAQVAAQAAAAEPPKPTLLGLNIPGVDLTYRPPMNAQARQPEQVAAVEPASYENASYTAAKSGPSGRMIAGTPGVQDRDEASNVQALRERKRQEAKRVTGVKPERVARASSPKAATSGVAERARADEAFVAAVTQPTRTAPPVVPVAAQSYAPMPERTDLLTALQRKARAMVEEEASAVTGSVVPAAPQPAVLPVRSAKAGAAIRSVTFDYENGIKTVIFQDGSIQEEQVPRQP